MGGVDAITFVGAGYVGLPWAAAFAQQGFNVYALDVDAAKVEAINQGRSPIPEPGLDELVKEMVSSGRLRATTDYGQAIPCSNVVFICVGTPSDDQGHADLGYVFAAVEKIAENLGDHFTVIVDRSTVPPGTASQVNEYIGKVLNGQVRDYAVVSSPEFLRQGSAIEDTLNPSRIIIGTDDKRATDLMLRIHAHLDCPKLVMSPQSAELVKYAANAYLANRIVFANQVSNLAEAIGADVREVLQGVGMDPRIGDHYWYPGLGYGGYCFPKDVQALKSVYRTHLPEEPSLFEALDELNRARIKRFAQKLHERLNEVTGKKIAVWGLSAKPQSPDMRGSTPALVVRELTEKGAVVHAYDPFAIEEARPILKGFVQLHQDPYEAVEKSEALLILTEHQELAGLDYQRVRQLMRGSLLLDAIRLLDPTAMKSIGFDYWGTGYGQ